MMVVRSGAYILLVRVKGEKTVKVGGLGKYHFAAGNYVYVGSAMAGLEARVKRHMKRTKKLKWHIDYLVRKSLVVGAALFPSKKKKECALARTVARLPGTLIVPGFGCSDCDCVGHLFFLGKRPFGMLLKLLDKKEKKKNKHRRAKKG